MDRFVPLAKKSKKEQKKYHSMQRKTWNGLNPVTRTVPNGKGYDRKRLKEEERKNSRNFRDETPAVFVFFLVQLSRILDFRFVKNSCLYFCKTVV